MTARRSAQVLLSAAAMGAAMALAQTAVPSTDVPALKATLEDPAARPEQREQAAQRLLARPDDAARTILRNGLGDNARPAVQAAVAKALANHPTADPALVAPLLNLLDPANPQPTLDAAAHALTAFKADESVPARLLTLASAGDERVRVVAIAAAGTFVQQPVAATLTTLADPLTQPARVVTAARDALAYLSGLPASTNWQAWWDANRGKSADQFVADLASERSVRYDLARSRYSELETEFGRLLADLYQRTPREQRTEMLLRQLRSTDASVRAAACRIATLAAANDVAAQGVKEQLRQLVGDASPDVRRGAAQALEIINDPEAVVPLLVQLSQETDSSAKAALAAALRPTRDARAVPVLLTLLDDPSPETAQTAAETLAELVGDLRQADPAAADRTAEKLMATLKARTKPQESTDLRAALVGAVGPLQSRAAANDLLRMLSSPREDRRVRRAVLGAVGRYGNNDFTYAIAEWMSDATDPATRLAAVRAVGESAANFGDVQAALAERIGPNERQSEVRDAAWKVLTKLFAKAPSEQLGFWETKLRDDPVKLLVVLREQRDRAARAGDADTVAGKNQLIGDACMNANLFAEAIKAYQDALGYALANNKPSGVEIISERLLKGYLSNRQYALGVKFMEDMVVNHDPKFQSLGSILKNESEHLVEYKDYDAAAQLIDLALKMTPPLARQYKGTLEELGTQVKARFNQQNQNPLQPDEPVQSARLVPSPVSLNGRGLG